MFEPKQSHPKWYLWLYPYMLALRYNPKYFFRLVTGRAQIFGWHYEWENINTQSQDNADDEYIAWLHRDTKGREY